MQNLFEGTDLVKIRADLGLPSDCPFDRIIHTFFYSPRRTELVQAMSQTTKQNFERLFESLSLT